MGLAHSHDHSHEHGGHGHGHGHGHAHSHAPKDFGPAFAIGVALNTAFVVVEAGAGYLTGSMALIADAGHNLSDVLALLLAWGAAEAAKRPPRGRFTYGFKSSTILAAIANALLLAIAIGAILIETTHRLFEPGEPDKVYVKYRKRKKQRINQQAFDLTGLDRKGARARGKRMTTKPVDRIATEPGRWWKTDEDSPDGVLL